MSDGEWYYAVGGQQRGPVSFEALQALASSRQLQPQDLVWHAGMANWQPAGSVENLFPPPRPGYPPEYPGQAPAPGQWSGGTAPLGYYTPNVAHVHYAGFWIRVAAAIIDSLVTGVAGLCVGGLIGGVLGFAMGAGGSSTRDIEFAAELLGNVLGIVLGWLYEAIMTSSSKQATLGKMAAGIVVVDQEGQRLSFGRATGRHFAKYLSALALLIGYIMVAFTQRKQGLHDMIAGTYVVYGKRP